MQELGLIVIAAGRRGKNSLAEDEQQYVKVITRIQKQILDSRAQNQS